MLNLLVQNKDHLFYSEVLHAEDENVQLLQFFEYELIIIDEKCL